MYSLTTNFLRSLNIKRGQKGQALVEMALSIMLLVVLVFGIIEFGRAMYTKNTLTNMARAGVRAAVVTPTLVPADSSASLSCPNADPVLKVVCESLVTGMDSSKISVTTTDESGNSPAKSNDTINVTIQLTGYESLLPKLIPMPSTLTGEASMRYE